MAEETIQDRIEQNAKGVARVSVDGTTTDAVDIDKQITADKYLKQQTASSRNHCGLTFRTLTPGGCG